MYIVYATGLPDETVVVEDKKEAVAIATQLTTENTVSFGVYKATLVAQAVTGVFVQKVKNSSKPLVAKPISIKKPKLDPILKSIAEDPEGSLGGPSDIPLGARCALDNNIAVGRKKGPTGEFVYLCMGCMGEVEKNV